MGSGGKYLAVNGSFEHFARYQCRTCSHLWSDVPPNRPMGRRPASGMDTLPATNICEVCGQTFRRVQSLRDHCKRHHPTASDAAMNFLCSKCGLSFKTRAYCRDHQRLCTRTGDEIVCRVCNNYFQSVNRWKIHVSLTGHKGHYMHNRNGNVTSGIAPNPLNGSSTSRLASVLVHTTPTDSPHNLPLGIVGRLAPGECIPSYFAEVLCAYRIGDDDEIMRDEYNRAHSVAEKEDEVREGRWAGAANELDDEDSWSDSDDDFCDATQDGQDLLHETAGVTSWSHAPPLATQEEPQLSGPAPLSTDTIDVPEDEMAEEFFS